MSISSALVRWIAFRTRKTRRKLKFSRNTCHRSTSTHSSTRRGNIFSRVCVRKVFRSFACLLVFSSEAWIWHWFVNAFQQAAMASRKKNTRWGTSEKLLLRIIYLRFKITRKFTATPSHNLLKRFDCSYITSASLFSLRLARVFVSR